LFAVMANPAIRVTFIDSEAACRRWDAFGNRLSGRVFGFARKRDGASHVVLLRGMSESQARQVAEWCVGEAEVLAVAAITESEFWSAPSNAV
jgi:hypothetical protein